MCNTNYRTKLFALHYLRSAADFVYLCYAEFNLVCCMLCLSVLRMFIFGCGLMSFSQLIVSYD